MTSRLTLSALAFAIASTAFMVWTAEAQNAGGLQAAKTAPARVVQLERVTITAPRLPADA